MERYQLIQEIGSGSYSTVYQAEDLKTKEIVAIKIMKFKYSMGKKSQDLELNNLKRFSNNPCVIKLKEVFIKADIMHFVFQLLSMNLIEYYKSLRKQFARKMTELEIKVVLYQIAYALADMHEQGYIHRDIKPENILLNTAQKSQCCIPEAKLVDFGLSKKLNKDFNTKYIATRWYRAPQLLLDMNYQYSVDIFALGCVALELYLGFQAFPGDNAFDQLNKTFLALGTPTVEQWPEMHWKMKQKKFQIPLYKKQSLRNNIPSLSYEAADLFQKMLSCNPAKRISAKQILKHPYFQGLTPSLPQGIQQNLKAKQASIQIFNIAKLREQIRSNTGSTSITSPLQIKAISLQKPRRKGIQINKSKDKFMSYSSKQISTSGNTKKKKINLTIKQNFVHPLTERKKKLELVHYNSRGL